MLFVLGSEFISLTGPDLIQSKLRTHLPGYFDDFSLSDLVDDRCRRKHASSLISFT